MSSADFNRRRPGPGRPRHIPEKSARPAREEILDHAARLFVTRGFRATSTRHIAEAVGVRQASLYYHFPDGKDAILGELLEMTVRPALDILDELDHDQGDHVALYMLALHDAAALAALPHNIGVLPQHPDVALTPECQAYKAARRDLRNAYSSLGVSCASEAVNSSVDKHQLGGLILEVVESVIGTRDEGAEVPAKEIYAIAASCLRLCGVSQDQIEIATRTCVL